MLVGADKLEGGVRAPQQQRDQGQARDALGNEVADAMVRRAQAAAAQQQAADAAAKLADTVASVGP